MKVGERAVGLCSLAILSRLFSLRMFFLYYVHRAGKRAFYIAERWSLIFRIFDSVKCLRGKMLKRNFGIFGW